MQISSNTRLSAAAEVNWSTFLPDKLLPAIQDTLYMVTVTMIIAGFLGLIIGGLLYTTRQGNILANRPINIFLNILVNVVRPIPFIILLAALGPLTGVVVGTRLGVNAAIFAMCFAATFAISRIVEQNLVSIDPGVIEAARAMGASKMRILFTVMIPEALGPLILGYTFLVIGVVDMSAMAGYVGGGGLGKVAMVDGYQRFNDVITWSVVLVIILLVQLIQLVGNLLARKVMRR
ncbi:MAG: methionine ABC transporter permease [Rothia sp. (in: high G+C Gram-positive bacteria)]|nr:methionine ABC transporter permease [Rothia sp. (in: high G+C Gram-positive bacteria)]